MPATPTMSFSLISTVGALEVGTLVSVYLFGIVTCQVYTYYRKYPKDTIWLKLLVGTIWMLELGHTIAVTHALFTFTVTDFGLLEKLLKAPYSLDASILFSAFIGPLVQAWFAYRVLKFSGKLYIPVLCWTLSFTRFLGTIVLAVEAILGSSVLQYETQWQWLLTFVLSVGAVVDVIIAVSLVFFLRKHRQNSFRRTVRTINQLIIWTIETGLVTSIAAVTMLICFLSMKTNYIWIAIYTFLAKLFSNSFLAAINARNVKPGPESSREGNSTFIDIMPSMISSESQRDNKLHPHLHRNSTRPRSHPSNGISIEMTTEVIRDGDDGLYSPSSETSTKWEGNTSLSSPV